MPEVLEKALIIRYPALDSLPAGHLRNPYNGGHAPIAGRRAHAWRPAGFRIVEAHRSLLKALQIKLQEVTSEAPPLLPLLNGEGTLLYAWSFSSCAHQKTLESDAKLVWVSPIREIPRF